MRIPISEVYQFDSVKSSGGAKGVFVDGRLVDANLEAVINIVRILGHEYDISFYRFDTRDPFSFPNAMNGYDPAKIYEDGAVLE